MPLKVDQEEVPWPEAAPRRWNLDPPRRGGDLVVDSLLSRIPEGTPLGLSLRHRLTFPSGEALRQLRSYDGSPGLQASIVCVVDALIGLEKTRLELLDQIGRSSKRDEASPAAYHEAMRRALEVEQRLCAVLDGLLVMDGLVSYRPVDPVPSSRKRPKKRS